jgi:hypothetical protein
VDRQGAVDPERTFIMPKTDPTYESGFRQEAEHLKINASACKSTKRFS